MANLLYVTPGLIKKLHQHPAFRFWNPIMLNFPIRPIPLDERVFQPRPLKIEHGGFYLTSDMKFVYCSDKLLSFLYENQEMSFRLTAKNGVIMTVDGKQFTSLLGKVAEVITSSDVKLVNTDKVFHEYFDANPITASVPVATDVKVDPPAIKHSPKTKKSLNDIDADDVMDAKSETLLGKYEREFCKKIVDFRNRSKKSYSYLSEKYNLPVEDVKKIVAYFKKYDNVKSSDCELSKIPKKLRDEIVHMKRISKKSYKYLSERFKLSDKIIKDICAPYMKRPRKS